jgi:hypothetical protein
MVKKKNFIVISLISFFVFLIIFVSLLFVYPPIPLTLLGIFFGPWSHERCFIVTTPAIRTMVPYHLNESDPDYDQMDPYTKDNTIFLLDIEGSVYDLDSTSGADYASRNMASSYYMMYIYTRENPENSVYRIKRMTFKTAEYTADFEDFEINNPWSSFGANKESNGSENQNDFIKESSPNLTPEISRFSKFKGYSMYKITIEGDSFNYPFPKGGKFSVDVEVEIDKGETKSNYNFTYYFNIIKMNKRYLQAAY